MKKTNQNKKKIYTKKTEKPKILIYILLLAIAVIITYAKTTTFDFVNIDDGKLIYEKPLIIDSSIPYSECFESLKFNVHYKPLVFLSWKAEYQIFGSSASHFHLINWLLHLSNTILLFFIAAKLFRQIYTDEKRIIFSAFILTLLFSINPLRIESVAWATERKDVLFSLFFLSGWLIYIRYIHQKKYLLLILGSILYLMSGLSKSMGLTLIAVLFLTDLWYKRKFNFRLITEKIPFIIAFFILIFLYGLLDFSSGSEAISDISAETENINQVSSLDLINNLPHILQLIISASVRFILWVLHSLFPVRLSVIYPHDTIFEFLGISIYLFPIIIAALLYFGWKNRKKSTVFIAGFLFFAVTISPALAISSSGSAIFLSNRYTYIPSIGIFFILIYYINKLKFNKLKYFIYISISLFYFLTSIKMVNTWKNSETLFTQTLKVYPDSGLAHLNLGKYYREKNEFDKALEVYNKGIDLSPGFYQLYSNRGRIFFDQGQFELALDDYNKCLSLKPDYEIALTNRGAAFGMKKEWDKALTDLSKALEISPNNMLALSNRGLIYYNIKEYDKTISDYTHYLKLDPQNSDILNTLGLCYRVKEENEKAMEQFNRAIQIDATQGVFFMNRSYTFNVMGKKSEALKDAETAQSLGLNVNENYINYLKQ